MPSEHFLGPPCKDLVEFVKSLKEIPPQYKGNFNDISTKTIEAGCDSGALHVWESGDDLDAMLQLTQVIVKLKVLVAEAPQGKRKAREGAVIISQEKESRDAFKRLCELIGHLTGSKGKKHLNGMICAYDAVVVVKGVDYKSSDDASASVKRINTAIERVLDIMRPSTKRIVWHHGPILSFLLTWINTTTNELRSCLTAISITAALDLVSGVKPSPLGKSNKVRDLERLGQYAKKLDIPVIFLDPCSQLITYAYLGTYMYYWAYYANAILPSSVLHCHFHQAYDELVNFCFRLRGASTDTYGQDTIGMVQEHLHRSKAGRWARSCINPAKYTKELCQAAGSESAIHHAVQLADGPLALLDQIPNYPLPAFSRFALSPSKVPPSSDEYVAAPVAFNTSTFAFRAASSSPLRILLPATTQNTDIVTNRIRGVMMGVLSRVVQDKGMPQVGAAEKEMWEEVGNACCWAIDGCKGKMPKGVVDKVDFVSKKIKEGTWASSLGLNKSAGQGQSMQSTRK